MANKRAAELSNKSHSGSNRGSAPATGRSDTSSSSKTSSPTEQNKAQIDFQFLNFSHPSEAKASRARRTVRSHVTRQQHQREQAAIAAKRAKSIEESSPQAESSSSAQQAGPARTSSHSTPTRSLELPVRTVPSQGSPESTSSSPINEELERINPLEVYPTEWLPYIPRILEHYFHQIAADNPDLDNSGEKGLMRTRLLPYAFTDLASMHALMLVAATHYGKARGSKAHAVDLLSLRGLAIRAINEALGDESRATSDQIIIAVSNMAWFEVLFGDPQVYGTHMTGLLRLVSLRGGLPALGLDGLLEKFILWIDANAAHLVRGKVHFDRAVFPSSKRHPHPDPLRFRGGLSSQ
ncbi:hypothetical protein K431DRAFT_215635 [Polychaeton citri CBS 116435]|uniref:Uncharacterized protein n=1 Tax=Polychaeton citri CBS 116435 TaxID=1314669 RepID=A0A9P4QGR7_9PEZI|nr:hypothetical protein K431DRAFT_215635 [Polychaeton citri CBS 116435]